MTNNQYYNNKSKYPTCVPLPKKESDYLAIENALSELYSQDLKDEAIKNLGLDILLSNLKSLIDQKIYQLDLPAYDLLPEEDSENLVKSGVIYKVLLDYVKQSSLNELTEWLQTIINNRIDPLANTLNELINRYDLSAPNNLPEDYISAASMDAFLTQLGTAMGGTWTRTYNAETQEHEFTFVQN